MRRTEAEVRGSGRAGRAPDGVGPRESFPGGPRLLLDALVDPLRAEPLHSAEHAAAVVGGAPLDTVRSLLERHRLGPLWLDALERRGAAAAIPSGLGGVLRQQRREAGLASLLHEKAMDSVGGALEGAGIPHVFFKGVALARDAHGDPALRPAGDLDVLVAPAERGRARAVLEALDLEACDDPGTATHELALVGRGVCVDLHWYLLRPGRARCDLAGALLGSRRRGPVGWVAGECETVAALLVHQALTDHVTARLVRAVDLDRLARRPSLDWDAVVRLVRDAGLGVAAWASLAWARGWLATPVPAQVLSALAPGRLRARYLQLWLARDPAALYARSAAIVRGAFSLALQDGPGDAVRAVWTLARSRRATRPPPAQAEREREGAGSAATAGRAPPADGR